MNEALILRMNLYKCWLFVFSSNSNRNFFFSQSNSLNSMGFDWQIAHDAGTAYTCGETEREKPHVNNESTLIAQFSAKNRHYAIICDVIDETCGVFYRSYNKISKNNRLN